jgi:hypothetical protein
MTPQWKATRRYASAVLSRLYLPVVSHEIPPVDLPGHAAAACPNRDGYGRPPRLSYSG